MKKPSRRYGGWLFLGLVSLLYGLLALWYPDRAGQAMSAAFGMLLNLLPVLLLVFGLLLASNWWLDEKRIRQYFGREAGKRGWLAAILAGILSMGPVYPWYALLADWRGRGMSPALAAVFLYSRAIKLPLLPMLVHYFGLAFTIVLCGYLLLFALLNGLLMQRLVKKSGADP